MQFQPFLPLVSTKETASDSTYLAERDFIESYAPPEHREAMRLASYCRKIKRDTQS